jgi:hypothetical protein
MCSYSYLENNLIEQSNAPYCRRIYKLVNKQGENQFFLIHYFNDKAPPESSNEKLTDGSKEISALDTPHSNMSTSDE